MQISALLLGFVLAAAALAFVARPFWEKRKKSVKVSAAFLQHEKREAVLSALRDLDFDFKTGKVSDEDYQPLRAQLIAEAAQYMEFEKQEEEKLEALIKARRNKAQQPQTCEHCGAPMVADQRFCSKCGWSAAQDCPSCGNKLRAGDLFCSSCGTKIEIRMETAAQP
jgi:uncharacterized protein (DUF2249 family)